ncbi:MAG: 4Fe-4S dicluster domain-containing protein [Planctomycetota bacterium]|nr:MAG: 4Fe-4S dicluster domain-containing protein [Planctomycetota bacterium]
MPVTSKIEIKNASITKDSLSRLLKKICKERILIAPVRNDDLDDVNFLPVTNPAQICCDYDNTTTSPKEFFFPQYECMFTFSGTSHESIEAGDDSEEIVLFGLRACDVKAIELLDKFYERNFEDNYYLSKRQKSVIISVACPDLNDQCFCTATETGPLLQDGFDIQLLSSVNAYAVQIGSEKGLQLFEQYQYLFGPPLELDINKLLAQAKKQKAKFNLQKVYENLKQQNVDEDLWEDIGARCQSCGLCLFLCPTCSCYSVKDQKTPPGENRRSRQWDACYFSSITRMAGGNNPIRTNAEMIKRKYQHKLVQQIDEFGTSGCVGCGRCNLACVGNVNWLDNIIKIERAT